MEVWELDPKEQAEMDEWMLETGVKYKKKGTFIPYDFCFAVLLNGYKDERLVDDSVYDAVMDMLLYLERVLHVHDGNKRYLEKRYSVVKDDSV